MAPETRKLPAGPRMPAFIQQLRWLNPGRQQEALARYAADYGDVFTVKTALYGPLVFFSNPDAIRDIFAGSPSVFESPPMDPLSACFLGQHSLIGRNGDDHTRHRRLLMPAFRRQSMRAYFDAIRNTAIDSIARWPLDTPFAVLPRLEEITLATITSCLLGVSDEARRAELQGLILDVMRSLRRPARIFLTMGLPRLRGLTPYARFRDAVEQLDHALYREIEERKRELSERSDLLSVLLSTRELSDAEIRDDLVTLIVGGFESTSVILAWCLVRLLRHPAALEDVVAELAQVVGDGPLRPEHLPSLKVMDGCIKETMRLHPLQIIGARVAREDVRIGNVAIPANTCVVPCMFLAHGRPAVHDEPAEFRPQRWENKSPDPAAFFPFGGGYRRCIGAEFSGYQIKITLAQLLTTHRVRPASASYTESEVHGLLLAPAKGAPIIITKETP